MPNCKGDPTTLSEYAEYKITWTATRNPTQLSLQLAEIEVRGFLSEEAGMSTLGYEGEYVPSVIIGSADIKVVGGYSHGAFYDRQAFDLSTHKFEMYRDSLSVTPGSCMLVMFVTVLPSLSSLLSHVWPHHSFRRYCFTNSRVDVCGDGPSCFHGQ